MRECADGFVYHDAEMIEDYMKLCRCLPALMCGQLNRSCPRPDSSRRQIQGINFMPADVVYDQRRAVRG
jgi:hypothetical protein